MKKPILIIDDDDMIAIYIEALFGDNFEVAHATNGEDGIKFASALKPHLILLDVEMPGIDGYATCRSIHAQDGSHDVPIIFISSNISAEARIAGYDAGGVDYVTKPFVADELRRKIDAILLAYEKNRDLRADVDTATKAAMAAMANIGDAGRVLNFLREIVGFTGFAEIIEATLRTLETYQLDASVQLRSSSGAISRNHLGLCSPLEESVLSNMATCGRIVDLGKRSAFNYPHVTIIVNNMPRNNQDDYGRFKDSVAMIAEAVDLHMTSLQITLESIQRGDALLNVLSQNATVLRDFESRYNRQRSRSAEIFNDLVKDIEEFSYMGLTNRQEEVLQKIVRQAAAQAKQLYQEEVETDAIIKSLGDGLAANLQQELKGAAESTENRIELF